MGAAEMGSSDPYQQANINPYPTYVQNVVVTVVICVVLLIIMMVLFHFYSQYQLRLLNRRLTSPTSTTGPGALVVIANNTSENTPVDHGLDPSVVSALPTYRHTRNGIGDAEAATATATAECVVCLCDLEEGKFVRVLPNCNHKFHLACVDSWLKSHSTCPVCRLPVVVTKLA